jgi:hypothetical protein
MPTIRIAVQGGQIGNHSCPKGVQMDIPNQFLKIGLFLADDGFIPVLKKMPTALVPAVETDHISGQQPPHKRCQGNCTSAQKEVSMIRQKCPGKASRLGLQQKLSQPFEKILPVTIVPKDLSALNPPDDNMMKNSRSIQAR